MTHDAKCGTRIVTHRSVCQQTVAPAPSQPKTQAREGPAGLSHLLLLLRVQRTLTGDSEVPSEVLPSVPWAPCRPGLPYMVAVPLSHLLSRAAPLGFKSVFIF